MSSSRRRERRQVALRPSKQAPGPASAPSLRGFATPLALTAGLLALSLVPRVRTNEALTWSFWGATTVLLVWQAVLAWRMQGSAGGRDGCALILARPRAQHYVQSLCQLAVYAYWGWYWSPVYDYAPLLIAQLLFAYAFDILLAWSRRQDFVLGFGPFPIVFSTNLFLWFKDDWFIFQFALVAVGFLGKAFVRWQRDGRRVHIFNPSAFTLALFSLVLLLTDTTHLTWGQEINTTFSLGPRIYTVIFVIGLVVMYFFAITAVTAMAAATLFAASALYVAVTGVPYFVDSEIPSAVFLGLHLLVTDPSTSPRTPLGRAIFGVLYGLGVFTIYAVLEALGLPTFYDKLLCVPLLNLAVPAIDRAVRALGERPILSRVGLDPPLGRANLAHMGAWGMLFAAMTVFGATDGRHRGDSLPFWEQACRDNRTHACERLMRIEDSYCADNAGWACNELGRHYVEGRLVAADLDRALTYFSRACEGRFQAGCVNLLDPERPRQANPRALDLRLLLRESGPNLLDMPEPELYARACRHGWSFACQPRSASR
ncbi:MAG: RnfABCDGE type electron transport complex subunit D [Vicinamibacterales bacterium]